MYEREKSDIEEMIAKKIESLESYLELYKNKAESELNSYEKHDKENLIKKIAFLKKLLSNVERLEESVKELDENTFDNNKVKFLIENLPTNLSEKLVNVLNKDREKFLESFLGEEKRKIQQAKDNMLNSIRNFNVIKVHKSYNDKSVFDRLKKNMGIIKRNEKEFKDIIQWINDNFIREFSKRLSGKTYFVNNLNRFASVLYNKESIEDTDYTDYVNNELGHIGRELKINIEKCQELLSFTKINPVIKTKIQKYKDVLRQQLKLEQLKECINNICYNEKYEGIGKTKQEIGDYLKKSIEKCQNTISKLDLETNIQKLYSMKKEEIEKTKAEKESQEAKRQAVLQEREEDINPKIHAANKKWMDDYIKNSIKSVIGREPTEEDERTDDYLKYKVIAEKRAKEYIEGLNSKYAKYYLEVIDEDLYKYVMDTYNVSEEEVESVVSYMMMSPEEKYIYNMVEAKKLPIGTKVEDLTAKQLNEIKRNRNLYVDSNINRFVEQKNEIQSARFTSLYGIEFVEKAINEIEKLKEEAPVL